MIHDLEQELQTLEDAGLLRTMRSISSASGPRVSIEGRECLLFCSNDYLGLSAHPELKAAAAAAIQEYGTSAAASRLISGNFTPHVRLERELASFFGEQSALVFPTGYAANIGAIAALVGSEDAIFSDRLNHRSIVDGCRLSRARVFVYDHADVDHLRSLLATSSSFRRRLIVTDGLFSMDGDLVPLPELIQVAKESDAILMVDDAHATGVLGRRGRGTAEHFGVEGGIDVLMTAGSKGLGSMGGFIVGSEQLVAHLVNRAAPFIYTTALSPASCAASTRALQLVDSEPERRDRLDRNSTTLREGLQEHGFETMDSSTHIVPVLLGTAERTMRMAEKLFEAGFFATGIRPPTVPEGTSRIRLTVRADHSEEDVAALIDAIASLSKA